MSKRINNIRGDAFSDQVKAAIRDGVKLPEECLPGDYARACVRSFDVTRLPEAMRDVTRALMKEWSEAYDVDIPEGNEL